jgi:hypothetical protein
VESDKRAMLKRELRRLWRSIYFVSRHASLDDQDNPESERFAELYQQLGVLWEFLGLQCRHWDGYHRNRSGKICCRICGKLKGAKEHWLLLPRIGNKGIGRRNVPTSKETFPNKRAAVVLTDAIRFHGVRLAVDVQNSYRSRLLHRRINIAPDRIVRFEEDGIECVSDTFDTETGRTVIIGRHSELLVLIPIEAEGATIIPVTVHATTRQQINFGCKPAGFEYESPTNDLF